MFMGRKINRHIIIVSITTIAIITAVFMIWIRPAINTIHIKQDEIEQTEASYNNYIMLDFKYDFEHLMRVLEDDWPFFELSIGANGVDVRQLADDFRYTLTQADIDTIGFLRLLIDDFFLPIGLLGHLEPVINPLSFRNLQHASLSWTAWEFATYGRVHTAYTRHLEELARNQSSRTLFEKLQNINTEPEPGLGEQFPVYDMRILSNNTALLTVTSMVYLNNDPGRQPGNMGYYGALLYDFWDEIEDFDHLIIDLRGNLGGHICHFSMYVASMLVTSHTRLPAYVFFRDGHYSNISMSNYRPVGGYTVASPMPAFHVDPGDFEFVFYSATSWMPASFYHAWGYNFAQKPPFAGRVWVLTDEITASSAEAVVAMFLLNDLATVVGKPTFGILNTGFDRESMHFALPNTGIIVRIDTALFKCYSGNYLQGYGLQPHYAPLPGMDALETVLTKITDGA